MTTDINCDLGEYDVTGSEKNDEAILPFITSVNIACGMHAGNPYIMDRTIRLALKYGLGIGAHAGYPDRDNFGRKSISMSDAELRASVIYQTGAIKSMVEANGGILQHVKPHGALYNDAAVSYEKALVVAQAVMDVDPALVLVGLSGSQILQAAASIGLPFVSEVFADRAYSADGTLVPRKVEGSVLKDTDKVIKRVIRMVKDKEVESIDGGMIPVMAETVCIHGDNTMALEFAEKLSEALPEEGIELKAFGNRKIWFTGK